MIIFGFIVKMIFMLHKITSFTPCYFYNQADSLSFKMITQFYIYVKNK